MNSPRAKLTRGERVINFIERYCRVPEGALVGQPMQLLPFQKQFILAVYDNPQKTKKAILSIARKNGKALCLKTKIPTPTGWKTMGDLQVGDFVFDEKGKPCRVTFATKIQYKRKCYKVSFSDGSHIIADADHQWGVHSRALHGKYVVKTTKDLLADYVLPYSRQDRLERNYSVPIPGPIKCKEKKLVIEPYSLGVWLGDGKSSGAYFYSHISDSNMAKNVSLDGYPARRVGKKGNTVTWSISDGLKDRSKDCFKKRLRQIGVLNNKHIPNEYLWASEKQRMALLQGLMDTDGYISKAGQCEFTSTNKNLAYDTLQLIRSLGLKASIYENDAMLYGKNCGKKYRIQFWAYKCKPVFRLARKVSRLKEKNEKTRNHRKYITDISPVKSVPVRCIQVDSPSSLFLAGDGFTPTHNTALISAIVLAHLVGPEARQNTQMVSGALSRDQAALVFDLAIKIIRLSHELSSITKIVPSKKQIFGLPMNVEFKALSAEGKTAHGLSPAFALLDEIGQIEGPRSPFVEAITTSQGAHKDPLLMAISTQASNDTDLLSVWIDDALNNGDPHTICHLYTASADADLMDEQAWAAANPALGIFRSKEDMRVQMEQAQRMPSMENSVRNLLLNQRVTMSSPFVSKSAWLACGEPTCPIEECQELFGGLDLSARTDLTAFLLLGYHQGTWNTYPFIWTPSQGIFDRAKRDRTHYDLWAKQGHLLTTPGATVDYEYVANDIKRICDPLEGKIAGIAFDRWRMDVMQKEFERITFNVHLVPWGQGFYSMGPALDSIESMILNKTLRHGNHPVLTMAAANTVIGRDAAGNRKPEKNKSTGRIDPMVALIMAAGLAAKLGGDMAAFDSFISNPLILR